MSAVSKTFEAITVTKDKRIQLVNIETPGLFSPKHVRVAVHAIGINPTDWKSVAYLAPPDVVVGCDAAGVVTEIGSDVSFVKIGDRVSGFNHGCKFKNNGSFAQQVQFFEHLVFKVPETMSTAKSPIFIPHVTAALGLFQSLGFEMPSSGKTYKDQNILIWAASTSVGMHAVALAKAIGLNVIATTSTANFALVKSLGADEVVDYKLGKDAVKEVIAKASGLGSGKLQYAYDCISNKSSMEFASQCLEGGKMVTILPEEKNTQIKSGVNNIHILMYTVTGESFDFGPTHYPAKPEDVTFARTWTQVEMPYLSSKKFEYPSRTRMVPESSAKVSGQSFEKAVNEAFDLLKNNKISAEKIAIELAQVAN